MWIATDHFKERDNVLVLLADRLCLGTVPPSEATRLERTVSERDIGNALGTTRRDILLSEILMVEAHSVAGTLDIEYGAEEKLSFTAGKHKIPAFLAALQQDRSAWDEVARRDTAGGIAFCLLSWGAGLVVTVITALLYWGIAAGWITRGPAWLATIVNLLGLIGLLVVGGILVFICLLAGLKILLLPGSVIRLTRVG